MVGMADGFAQASGKTTVVNLHTAPGVGNAMGAIFNAQANHSPLLVTAGQQARAQITLQANLTNRDATRMPHPLVKWSYEPPRAEDVPLALAHGAHLAGLPPRGPVFVSLPMDDWDAEVDAGDAQAAIERRVSGRAVADPEAVRALAARARRRRQPGPRRRPRHRRQRRLGPRRRPRRAPAAAGLGLAGDRRRPPRLPREPPQLPRRAAAGDRPGRADARGPRPDPRRRQLGLPLLPAHPRAAAARGREAGRDHQRPRRGGAGADGRRDRRRREADPGGAAGGGARVGPPGAGAEPGPGRNPARPTRSTPRPSTPRWREVLPEDAIVVLESPSSTLALRNQLRLSRPGSYYFSAGGGLGFGLAASVGVQLAAAGPAGRLRARRGLGPVRDHRLLERRRLRHPGHLPGPAQRGVRDPQVVRRSRAGDRRPRPRPAQARRRRGRRGLRRQGPPGRRPRRGRAAPSPTALASSKPELVEVPVAPGMSLF